MSEVQKVRFYGRTFNPDEGYAVPYISIKLIGPPDFFVGSNDKGNFSIEVPPRQYKMAVRSELYQPITENIALFQDTYKDIPLQRAVV